MQVEILNDVNFGQYKVGQVLNMNKEEALDLINAGAAKALGEDVEQQPQPEAHPVAPQQQQPPEQEPTPAEQVSQNAAADLRQSEQLAQQPGTPVEQQPQPAGPSQPLESQIANDQQIQ